MAKADISIVVLHTFYSAKVHSAEGWKAQRVRVLTAGMTALKAGRVILDGIQGFPLLNPNALICRRNENQHEEEQFFPVWQKRL